LLIRLFFLIICSLFLTNCSKNELSNYVRFSKTTAQVSAVSGTITIRVEWSHVQWSISPEGRTNNFNEKPKYYCDKYFDRRDNENFNCAECRNSSEYDHRPCFDIPESNRFWWHARSNYLGRCCQPDNACRNRKNV